MNSTWRQLFGYPNGDVESNEIRYFKDTVEDAQIIKVLSTQKLYNWCGNTGPRYIYVRQRADSVWLKHWGTSNTWQLYHCFNAVTGNTWSCNYRTSEDTSYVLKFRVVNTATEILYGTSLSTQTISIENTFDHSSREIRVNNRFMHGGIFLLPNYSKVATCTMDSYRGTWCYSDSTFGVQMTGSFWCYYTTGLHSAPAEPDRIFPNPAVDHFSVTTPHGSCSLAVTDVLGNLLIADDEYISGRSVTISHLPRGFYFVTLSSARGRSVLRLIRDN
jgi:hypothetical protein